MQVSSSIPWQLPGVAGGQNKSVLVLEPVESQGGRMVARKKGTSTCRLIRSLKDYVLCRHSFGAPAESGQYLVAAAKTRRGYSPSFLKISAPRSMWPPTTYNPQCLMIIPALGSRGVQAATSSISSARDFLKANWCPPSSKKVTQPATSPAEPVAAHIVRYFDLEHILAGPDRADLSTAG